MKEFSILVVDDTINNIQTIVEYLEASEKPYQVWSTMNGYTALQIIQKRKPDLIITDWEMPEMSGLELIETIKQKPEIEEIPCIVVTGMRISPGDLKLALDKGAIDFIRKPINKIELWARVESSIQLFESYRTIKAQKKEIEEQKNRELSTKTLQIYQKNQMLSQVNERLHKAMLQLEIGLRKDFKAILTFIQHNIQTDSDWDNFKLHFEKVHPQFFHILKEKHPSLTPNDLKWCAYIRIGLSAREIANMLNIDYSGARVQKARLKKKIALSSEENLDEYIQKIF